MKNQVIDADDLVKSANDVENAMKGLSLFAYYNISSTDVSLEVINGLNGLVEAGLCLAERHSELCSKFSE